MKRILAIGLVVLGMYAEVAEAECAWVLWKEFWSVGKTQDRTWTVLKSYPSAAYSTCVQDATAEADWHHNMYRLMEHIGNPVRLAEGGRQSATVVLKDGMFMTTTFVCFPDTIDPRSKK